MAESTVNGSYIIYKNRPLVREDNIVCYGSMEEKFFLQLIIMSEKEYGGNTVPDKVVVQIVSTEDKKVVKQDLKDGFYNALELGMIWLDRQLGTSK